MPLTTITQPGGPAITYDEHIPAVQELLATLPPLTRPYSTFKGGAMLRVTSDHFVAVLMPPCGDAQEHLTDYLANYFDGDWEVTGQEYYGQVEAWHLMAPWRPTSEVTT